MLTYCATTPYTRCSNISCSVPNNPWSTACLAPDVATASLCQPQQLGAL